MGSSRLTQGQIHSCVVLVCRALPLVGEMFRGDIGSMVQRY